MELKSTLTNKSGQEYGVVYRDADSAAELGDRKVSGVHAYCFCEGKLVVVYDSAKDYWSPPGGGVEAGESVEEAVIREVLEESNMRVLSQRLIGFQDISGPNGIVTQTRSVCIVECIGPFVVDPAGDVSETKLIEPDEYKHYFDWKEIGDHVMKRARALAAQM